VLLPKKPSLPLAYISSTPSLWSSSVAASPAPQRVVVGGVPSCCLLPRVVSPKPVRQRLFRQSWFTPALVHPCERTEFITLLPSFEGSSCCPRAPVLGALCSVPLPSVHSIVCPSLGDRALQPLPSGSAYSSLPFASSLHPQ
jgi:hypothetical protein